jgi:hypothetical protein
MSYTVAQTSEDAAEPATVVASSGSNMRHIKLPDFWPQAPLLWSHKPSVALHLMASRMNFPATAWRWGALSHDSLQRVADIIEKPPQVIKHRLLGVIIDYLWTE